MEMMAVSRCGPSNVELDTRGVAENGMRMQVE